MARRVGAVGLAASFALAVRLATLYGIGAGNHPLNYDEGGYLSFAALWSRGTTIHRDVVAVHPPGSSYLLAPLTWIGPPSTSLLLGRVVAALIGAASAYLIGRITLRYASTAAAVVAVLAYALAPDAVLADRSVVLEPLLNLACLSVAVLWVRSDPRSLRRMLAVAALIGAAASIKLWGAFLLVPLVATLPRPLRVRRGALAAAVAGLSWAAVVAPVALRAPSDFVEQVIVFSLARPDTVPTTWVDRLFWLAADPRDPLLTRNLIVTIALVGLGSATVAPVAANALRRRRTVPRNQTDATGSRVDAARFACCWFATVAVAMLAAPVHLEQYNAHLAAPAALVVGWTVDRAVRLLGRSAPRPAVRLVSLAGVLVLLGVGAQSARVARAEALDRTQQPSLVAEMVRDLPACTHAFEPAWLIVADRWPDPALVGPTAVDPFGAALVAAIAAGEQRQQLDAPAARATTRDAVLRCDTVVLGARGRWHLGKDEPWFREHFRLADETWPGGPDVWRRRIR